MTIHEQSIEIVHPEYLRTAVTDLADAIRTSYESAPPKNITKEEADSNLVKQCIASGHTSPLEHLSVSVRIVTDRALANEIVRHRMASYTQSSTRYINYDRRKYGYSIPVVRPGAITPDTPEDRAWQSAVEHAENTYKLLRDAFSPEVARSVLPQCTMCRLYMTANLREWRHILSLRVLGTTGAPHPDLVRLFEPLLYQLNDLLPEVFGDLYRKYTARAENTADVENGAE